MIAAPRHVNDGTSAPPRLAIFGNEWAMLELPKLPHDRAWTFEETADKMVAAGFHGIQTQAANKKILDARQLRFADLRTRQYAGRGCAAHQGGRRCRSRLHHAACRLGHGIGPRNGRPG